MRRRMERKQRQLRGVRGVRPGCMGPKVQGILGSLIKAAADGALKGVCQLLKGLALSLILAIGSNSSNTTEILKKDSCPCNRCHVSGSSGKIKTSNNTNSARNGGR